MCSIVNPAASVCQQLTADLAAALVRHRVSAFDAVLAFENCGSTMEEAAKFYSAKNSESIAQAAVFGSEVNSVVVVAKEQSAGRGREGRKFVSAPNSGIWATFAFSFPSTLDLAGLSLAIGVGLREALAKQQLEVGLKWPNDVVVFRPGQPLAKLAGVLIESTLRQGGQSNVRIGVGLNLQAAQSSEFVSVGLCQLCEALEMPPLSYQDAFVLLAEAVAETWSEFVAGGFESFAQRWSKYSIMLDKTVSFTLNGESRRGVVRGVADDGALIVEPPNETAISIYGGEVKLLDVTSY